VEALGQVRDSVALWLGADPAAAAARLAGADPLRIRLHGSEASFERVNRRLASGRFSEQRAFSHARSRTAHILSESHPDPARWRRFGPGMQGERLAVHEAAHLVSYALAEDPRWPSWVAEGLAAHAEEGWARRRGVAGVAEGAPEPWLEGKRDLRARLLEAGALPGIDEVLRTDLAHLPLQARYAAWAGVLAALLEPPFRAGTLAFLSELAGPPPPGGWSAVRVRRRFEAHFDARDRAALDAQVAAAAQGAPTGWQEFRRSAGHHDGGILQVPVSGDPFLWRPAEGEPGPGAFVLRGRVESLPGAGEGRGEGVLLALGVRGAMEGAVGVILARGRPAELARVPLETAARPEPLRDAGDAGAVSARSAAGAGGAPPLPDGAPGPHAFTLTLADGVLDLRLGGAPAGCWELPGVEATGGWGIGTVGRTAALWQGLERGPAGNLAPGNGFGDPCAGSPSSRSPSSSSPGA
jgi:hypothetical protein